MRVISRVHPLEPIDIEENLYAVIDVSHYQAERYLNIMKQLRRIEDEIKMHINFLSVCCDDVSFYKAHSLFLPEFVFDDDPNFKTVLSLFPEKRAIRDRTVKIFPAYIVFSGRIEGSHIEADTFELTKEALEIIGTSVNEYSIPDLAKALGL